MLSKYFDIPAALHQKYSVDNWVDQYQVRLKFRVELFEQYSVTKRKNKMMMKKTKTFGEFPH